MLKEHPDRVFVNFAVDFDAQIGYARRLSEAVEAVHGRLPTKQWACTTERYYLRDIEKRFVLSLEFARIGFTSLGLDTWTTRMTEFVSLFKLGLDTMGVEKLKRVGFKTQAFIATGMSHSEMCDLMFGSFLVEAKELENVCGKPTDTLVQLHGTHKGMRTLTVITPANSEQSAQSFMANPGLDLLVEPKLYDTGLRDFRDRIPKECLLIENDLFQLDPAPSDIQGFARESLEASEDIAEAVIFKLKRIQGRRGGRNGNPK